jgi:hypothetical protein
MGEYMGRILYIDEGKRIQAISLTIVSSMGQLLVTLVVGVVGLLLIRSEMQFGPSASSTSSSSVRFGSTQCYMFLYWQHAF